jgi:hypothetical protein
MEFQRYIANHRAYRPVLSNPYADDLADDLTRHLRVVERWIAGDMYSAGMLDAMIFFSQMFPGQYSPDAGKKVWRGQARAVFDGSPRSYSYSKKQAEAFAEETASCGFFSEHCSSFLIERPVCFHCKDAKAFEYALDLKKLMRAYSSNQFAEEQEVVLLNTKPVGQAEVWELEV